MKKILKRITSILISFIFIFNLVACSTNETPVNKNNGIGKYALGGRFDYSEPSYTVEEKETVVEKVEIEQDKQDSDKEDNQEDKEEESIKPAITKPDAKAFKPGDKLNGKNNYLKNISWVTKAPKSYEKIELEMDIDKLPAGINPFREQELDLTIQLKSSTGKELNVDGFYYEEYEYNEKVFLSGRTQQAPDYRFRVTLIEEGTWDFVINLKVNGKQVDTVSGYINAAKGEDTRGYVIVEPNVKRTFKFQNGGIYFPVGHNTGSDDAMSWYSTYKEILDEFTTGSKYGMNFARIWHDTITMTYNRLGENPFEYYDGMSRAYMMDSIIEAAEKYDIYIQFAIFSYHFYADNWPDGGWKSSAFNAETNGKNGGYLTNPNDFFTDKAAVEGTKNLTRYIIARHGYSQNIMAWEIMNETDHAGDHAPETNLIDTAFEWTKDMVNFVRETDTYGHLVTSNAGMYNHSLLYREGLYDFTTFHRYGVIDHVAELAKEFHLFYNKPATVGEIGYANSAAFGVHEDLIGFHQQNYVTLFGGAGGAGHNWFWRDIRNYNAFWDYKVVSDIAKQIPWDDPLMFTVTNSNVEVSDSQVRVLGYRSIDYAYLWISDMKLSELNKVITEFDKVKIALKLKDDEYVVRWVDTWTGKSLGEEKVKSVDGIAEITTPKWTKDIAVKITKY